MNNAYITFLSTDNYIYYVLALFDSWKETKSKYPFYCCITDNVSEKTVSYLDKVGINHILLDNKPFKDLAKKMSDMRMVGKYVNALSKLGIFNLTEFDKCVYLDSDLLIKQNIDDLFNKPAWTAVEDCLPYHKRPQNYVLGESSFCSGMFVFEPDADFYLTLLDDIPNLPKGIKWHDQAILAYYHKDWMQRTELHLPCEYDLLIAAQEDVLNKYYQLGGIRENIKVEHYVSHKDSPYSGKAYYFWDNVFSEYYDYYVYINKIIDKYDLDLEKNHLENMHKKSDKDVIDLVVPYVDNSSIDWLNDYNKYVAIEKTEETNAANRFRGQGDFFKYFFRGIELNMPWINNLYLLVSDESQVPGWLNRDKIRIILHKDFIPEEYLPTFNSCTIEQFLWRIPGLAEKFIYANDDFLALKKLSKNMFFDKEAVKFNLINNSINKSMYDQQCKNCDKLIYQREKSNSSFNRIGHIFRPYLKSKMIECFELYKKDILNSLSQFRDFKNYNCYIYSLYLDKINKRSDSGIKNGYIGHAISESKFNNILTNNLTVCINDSKDTINIYENKRLISYLDTLFKFPSIYEKNYSSKHKNISHILNDTKNIGDSTIKNKPIKKEIKSVKVKVIKNRTMTEAWKWFDELAKKEGII